jgi:hypothetical protein
MDYGVYGQLSRFQICKSVLGTLLLLKLMFLESPMLAGSWPLLVDRATSVPDDLLGALSLLSNGLLDDGYGTTVETLRETWNY